MADQEIPVGDIEAAVEAAHRALASTPGLPSDGDVEALSKPLVELPRPVIEAAAPLIAGPAFERGREAGLQEARERLRDLFGRNYAPPLKLRPAHETAHDWLWRDLAALFAALGSSEPDGREECAYCKGTGRDWIPGNLGFPPECQPCEHCDGTGKADGRSAPAVTKDGGGSSGPGVGEDAVTVSRADFQKLKNGYETLMVDHINRTYSRLDSQIQMAAMREFLRRVENGGEA